MVFSTLVFAQIFNAIAFRSFERVGFELGTFTNPRLLVVMAVTIVLFDLGPFSWKVMGLSLGGGLIPATVLELWKLARRSFIARQAPGS